MRLEGLLVRRFGHFREAGYPASTSKTTYSHIHTRTHTLFLSLSHTYARAHITFGVILIQQSDWQYGQAQHSTGNATTGEDAFQPTNWHSNGQRRDWLAEIRISG